MKKCNRILIKVIETLKYKTGIIIRIKIAIMKNKNKTFLEI